MTTYAGSYNYQKEKAGLLTDQGQRRFVESRDDILAAIRKTGAIRMAEAIGMTKFNDNFAQLATVERMVEIGDLREVGANDPYASSTANRVFVRAR